MVLHPAQPPDCETKKLRRRRHALAAWAELVLADGGRIHFDRVSSGTSFANALFRHVSTPTSFFESRLGWVGLQWAMRFADGSLASFKSCGPANTDLCSLMEMRDADGPDPLRARWFRTALEDPGPTKAIAFDYDARRRIVRAYDSPTHGVSYSYDDGGRMSRVTASDGTVRAYTCDSRDEMIAIDEPGWVINNTFDEAGRVMRQVTHLSGSIHPTTYEFAYTVSNGSVVQTDMTENGVRTRYTYNSNHYETSKTFDADGPNPIVVSYDRSADTNLIRGLTVRCIGSDGHVIRTVAARSGPEDAAARNVIQQECR